MDRYTLRLLDGSIVKVEGDSLGDACDMASISLNDMAELVKVEHEIPDRPLTVTDADQARKVLEEWVRSKGGPEIKVHEIRYMERGGGGHKPRGEGHINYGEGGFYRFWLLNPRGVFAVHHDGCIEDWHRFFGK